MKYFLIFLKKELTLDSRYLLPLIQNLIVSPMVTAFPLLLVYRNIFSSPGVKVADWSAHNYATQVVVGLVCHFCLNSGNYLFYNRLATEFQQGTLALIWLAPMPRVITLLTLGLGDLLRVLVFSLVVVSFLPWTSLPALTLPTLFLIFLMFYFFGTALALLRLVQRVVFPGFLDIFNFLYLGLLLTSGLYFPTGVLPGPLITASQWNPLYYGKLTILSLLDGRQAGAPSLLFTFPFLALWGVVIFALFASHLRVTEECLKN